MSQAAKRGPGTSPVIDPSVGLLGRGGSAEEGPELRALAAHFDRLTLGFVADAQRNLDLARAQQDEAAAVREHVKMQVMHAARIMFQGSYHAVCGERPLEIRK